MTVNFAWGFSRHFVNSGRKDRAKFPNFDPCIVCGKPLPVSGGVYLPAFWATPHYCSITIFLGHTPYYNYKEQIIALLTAIWMSSGTPGTPCCWTPLFPLDIQIAVSSAIIGSLWLSKFRMGRILGQLVGH